MPSFNLNDYVSVAERLEKSAAEVLHIQTDPPVLLTDVMGYIRATVSLKDGRTATGTAHFRLDAQRGPEATDPLEKCETSAIGRALKHLGYGVSREEAERIERNRAAEQRTATRPQVTPTEAATKFWSELRIQPGNWEKVTDILGYEPQRPTTVDEWRGLFITTRDAQATLEAEAARHEAEAQ